MKRWIVAGLAVLLLIGFGGAWLWSLGSVPAIPSSPAILIVDAMPVELKRPSKDEWESAASGQALGPGDEIRTGLHGRAAIQWHGRAESRISEQTHIVIDAAELVGPSRAMSVSIRITAGRMWSRVLRLFDLDESFVVTTNAVVATVRGTAFDVGVASTSTAVWVAESAVDISAPDSQRGTQRPFAIADGHLARRAASGVWGAVVPLSTEDIGTDWFMRNHAADLVFLRTARTEIENALAIIGRAPVSSALLALTGFGERMHLAVAGANAPRLRAAYLMRRLNTVKTQIDEGRSGLAYQSLNTVERDLDSLLTRPDGLESALYLRQSFAMLSTLLRDDTADSPRYRLKQRMEGLMEKLARDDAEKIFSGLLAADARLDESVILIEEGRLADARMGIEAARQGLENANRDRAAAASAMSASRVDALESKSRAVRARIEALTERIRILEAPPIAAATSTEAIASTPTTTPSIPATQEKPASPATAFPWDVLTLTAQPNPLTVGGTATLRLIGSRVDATTEDLTPQAAFRLLGSLGELKGATYVATESGSVTIEASILNQGVNKTAQTTVYVNDVVRVTKLDIAFPGSTTVRAGAQVPLLATATYSSGLTANVTSKTSWQTSDASIGSVSGNAFIAAADAEGSVAITGSYAEDGSLVQSTIIFTVSAATSPN